MIPVIAIDGPAGSGKGTMARKIASHFGFAYLDTGILYRAIAYFNLSLEELKVLSVNDVFKKISSVSLSNFRIPKVSAAASALAKRQEIRDELTRMQREFASNSSVKGVVLDGRDIGTVVFPDAVCKLFITADLDIRAKRRFHEIIHGDPSATLQDIKRLLEARDNQDQSREVAPLVCDERYTIIDTSNDTVDESLSKAIQVVRNVCAAAGIKLRGKN